MHSCRRMSGLAVLLLFLSAAGCGSASSRSARQLESSHLRALVNLYNYAASKLGHRPANEVEFKSFIAANGGPMLESLKITNADELFVSERDGKPFVVMYGEPAKGANKDLVAYEQSGIGGKRLVGYSIGAVVEADEQEFAQLVPTQKSP